MATSTWIRPAKQPSSAAMDVALLRPGYRTIAFLLVALPVSMVLATGVGAVHLSPGQVLTALLQPLGIDLPWTVTDMQSTILWSIRLPRVLLAALVGGSLAVCGAALQGVVRNPLADAGLIGVQSGASLGAVAFLVLGAPALASTGLLPWLLPAAAFIGALLATGLALSLARVGGRTSSVALILSGVALAALAGAATGLILQVASDAQLRSVTFWNLGSLGGATWKSLGVCAIPTVLAFVLLPRWSRALDLLLLGEPEARHLGLDVEKAVRRVVVLVALAVGAAVATCGGIGFIGLVVPHLLRGKLGPGHRRLLPASMLGGAVLLVLADLLSRTIVAPAELPVGILTALVGTPVLLVLIRRGGRAGSL